MHASLFVWIGQQRQILLRATPSHCRMAKPELKIFLHAGISAIKCTCLHSTCIQQISINLIAGEMCCIC
jgi:hypothetical protein